MKLGKSSFVFLLRVILGTLFLRVSLALLTCFFLVLLLLGGQLELRLLFRNKFFDPAGKNLPFASRGNLLASFLPIICFFRDLRFLPVLFRLGIAVHFPSCFPIYFVSEHFVPNSRILAFIC